MAIGEVITERQTGLEVTNATLARTSPDASFRGVVAVSLAPQYFRDYYQSLAKEQPNLAAFSLVRSDGELIARWPLVADGQRRVRSSSVILSAVAANEKRGVVELPSTAGQEARLISYRRVEGYPLYVVAGVSRDAVYANWARFVALLAGILVPTSAGLLFVSWVALKRTQREAAIAVELREEVRRRGEAEQAALHSQKNETLAAVTGGVAHDFNNLLAIISTSLHLLKRKHPELQAGKQLEAMSRAVQTGMRLTRQLLSFTRKQALRPELVVLQNWLPSAEGLIRATLGDAVSWTVKVEPDTAGIHVDNLVVNARHAMPNGGSVHILVSNESLGGKSQMVAIRVRDSGVGIASELLPKVFEPFFSTRARGVGSGLGLSQVQGFCAQAGGSVEIKSVVGEGTTVCMYLPFRATPDAVPVEGRTQVEISSEPGRKPEEMSSAAPSGQALLLVEDNEDLAMTTEMMLKANGFQVVRKTNADEALRHLEGDGARPEAVISDIAMPGSMDGIRLAFTLQDRYPGLPVLLTTGYAEHLNEAVLGGLKVLAKPVEPEILLSELGKAIAGRRPVVG